MERDCESELSKLNIEQNACIYHFGASVIHGQRSNILRLLLIVSIGYVLYTITSCYLGTLNGIGKPTKSMILMIFYYIIIRIPFAYLLSWLAENLNGVWIAILISHIVACIITILTSNQIIKRLYGKLYDRTKKARYKSIESNCCGKF